MVAIYCATFVVYCILRNEKYMEQFNTKITADLGKNKELVQCCLTKIDTVQHMVLIICTDCSGKFGREKI